MVTVVGPSFLYHSGGGVEDAGSAGKVKELWKDDLEEVGNQETGNPEGRWREVVEAGTGGGR